MEMSPTSRNTLMIGGALILIALLLVCDPLLDRLGLGGKSVEEAPSVAAGPPLDTLEPADVLEAVAAGALVGTTVAPTDAATLGAVGAVGDVGDVGAGGDASDVKAADDSAVVADAGMVDPGDDALTAAGVAAAGVAAGAAGAGTAGDAGTGGGGAVRPAVSAGVPTTDVASDESSGAAAAGAAASAFDDALAAAMASSDELGGAGRAVERFAPPVAAAGGSPLALAGAAQPFGIDGGDLLRPCDTPGSGCQNLGAAAIGGGGGGTFRPSPPFNPRAQP